MKTIFVATGAVFLASGCSFLTPPAARPIIEDHAQNQVNTFAVQPSRRMMIVKSNVNRQGDLPQGALDDGLLRDKAVVFCAEASPDVTDDILATLAVSAAAQGPSSGERTAANASAQLAQALATSGQIMFKRSQALQLYRDAAYHLCQAKVNGFIKDAEFASKLDQAQHDAAALLRMEIPWLYMSQILAEDQQQAMRNFLKGGIIVSEGKLELKLPEFTMTVLPPKQGSAAHPPEGATGAGGSAGAGANPAGPE